MAKRRNRTVPGTPVAVTKAAKQAEDLHKELYGTTEDGTVQEAGSEADQQAPVEEQAGEGGDIQPVEPQAQTDSTGDTSETNLDSPTPDQTPAEAQPVAAPAEDWEQKYKALQGKYNAEVPRMAADIRALQQQLAAPPAPAPQPEPEPETNKSVVSEQDLLDYGEDLVDLIRRVATAESKAVAGTLTPKIEQIEGRVQSTVQAQTTNSVYSKLDADIQDWREINKSPEFLTWLNQSDPYAGDLRSSLLSEAFQKGDANRVTAFFKGYLAETQVVAPTVTPTPQPQATPQNGNGQMTLESLAGPSGGPSTGEVNTQGQQVPNWTRAQIAEFYTDVQRGHYEKNPQKKAQIENSIAQAMHAGRIS